MANIILLLLINLTTNITNDKINYHTLKDIVLPEATYSIVSMQSFESSIPAQKGSYVRIENNVIEVHFYFFIGETLRHTERIIHLNSETKTVHGKEGLIVYKFQGFTPKGAYVTGTIFISNQYNYSSLGYEITENGLTWEESIIYENAPIR